MTVTPTTTRSTSKKYDDKNDDRHDGKHDDDKHDGKWNAAMAHQWHENWNYPQKISEASEKEDLHCDWYEIPQAGRLFSWQRKIVSNAEGCEGCSAAVRKRGGWDQWWLSVTGPTVENRNAAAALALKLIHEQLKDGTSKGPAKSTSKGASTKNKVAKKSQYQGGQHQDHQGLEYDQQQYHQWQQHQQQQYEWQQQQIAAQNAAWHQQQYEWQQQQVAAWHPGTYDTSGAPSYARGTAYDYERAAQPVPPRHFDAGAPASNRASDAGARASTDAGASASASESPRNPLVLRPRAESVSSSSSISRSSTNGSCQVEKKKKATLPKKKRPVEGLKAKARAKVSALPARVDTGSKRRSSSLPPTRSGSDPPDPIAKKAK